MQNKLTIDLTDSSIRKKFEDYPHFFIVGIQRSGTTLLRILLNAHSEIAVPEEATFFMPFLSKRKLLNPEPLPQTRKRQIIKYLEGNSQFQKWGLTERMLTPLLEENFTLRQMIGFIYALFGSKHDKCIYGDKSPTFIRKLNILKDAYPRAKFIHIVRDGRDVHLSMKKKHSFASSVVGSSLEWSIKLFLIHRVLDSVRNRAIEVRYEDLVREPVEHLKRTCAFLGVQFEIEMLDFWKKNNSFVDDQHSNLIRKPIDASNAFKWRQQLNNADIKRFEIISRRNLTRYDYEVSREPVGFLELIYIGFELLSYSIKRIVRICWIQIFMRLASIFGWEVPQKFYD